MIAPASAAVALRILNAAPAFAIRRTITDYPTTGGAPSAGATLPVLWNGKERSHVAMNMRRLAFGLFLSSGFAFPQFLSFGFKAGVPFTDAFKTAQTGSLRYVSDTHRYTFGLTGEVNLPIAGLGVELDALYRRLDFSANGATPEGTFTRRTVTSNAWDFPLLLKWRFGVKPLQAFVTIGPTFRGLSNLSQAGNFFTGSPSGNPPELQNSFNVAFTAGVGVRLGNKIALSPEVRYTRWGWDNFRDPLSLLHTNRDQVDLLVGLTF